MSGWQPIETAPRDGTRLLLWWNERAMISFWADRVGFKGWQPVSGEVLNVGNRAMWNPTHWMPLPEPPK